MSEMERVSTERLTNAAEATKTIRDWISAQEAATYLNLTVAQIYYAVNTGNIRYTRFPNRRIMFKRAWLDAFKSGKPFGFWAKLIRMFQ